jgi:predicted anti-sigma-YlaC factor YlaD
MGKIGCHKIFEMVSSYIDNELSAEDCRIIEEHISACEPCKVYFKTLVFTVELSRKLECYECYGMPSEVSAKLREFLRAKCKCDDNTEE